MRRAEALFGEGAPPGATRPRIEGVIRSHERTWGKKLRLHAGEVEAARAAVDAETGTILACWSTRAGVFIAARPPGGIWSGPSSLHPTLNEATQLQLLPLGNETFLLRTNVGAPREWHVRPRLR